MPDRQAERAVPSRAAASRDIVNASGPLPTSTVILRLEHPTAHIDDPVAQSAESFFFLTGGTVTVASDPHDPEEVFDKVASDVRVDIIKAFAQYWREEVASGELPDRDDLPITLSFTEVFDRISIDDSGKFNYHLKKLLGSFVTTGPDDDYRLTMAGQAIAGSILSGAYAGRELEPTRLDSGCPRCGDSLNAAYTDGRVTVTCQNEHRMLSTALPTGAIEGRSVIDLLALATQRQRHLFELLRSGACLFCYGSVSTTAGATDLVRGDEFGVEGVCTRCGQLFAGDFEMYLSTLPAFTSFYADHGLSPQSRYIWELRAEQDDREVTMEEQTGRVSYHVELEGETFLATIGTDATVLSTRRTATDE